MKKNEKNVNRKYIVVIVIVVIMSITLLASTYISRMNMDKQSKTNVVAATLDIPENTIITEDMLVFQRRYIEDINVDTSFTDPADIIGKKSTVPIYRNEIINKFRIVEDNKKILNKDFAINLDINDKSLNLAKGTFVDIWKVPVKEGFKKSLAPEMIFKGQYIVDVKNEAYISSQQYDSLTVEDKKEIFVPQYILINLDENQVKKITGIDPSLYNIRVVLHNTDTYFENLKAVQNKIEEGSKDEKESTSVDDGQLQNIENEENNENNEKQVNSNDEEKLEVQEGDGN